MAISRVPGFSLLANLDRQGTDLYISSNGQTLTYFDVNNYRFGINNPSPQYELDILGNVQIGSGHLYTSANISFDIGTATNWWRNIYVNTITSNGLTISGNLNATYISGTLTTSAQPYVTSLGNLISLTVDGNITAGNVDSTYLIGTILTGSQPYITNLGNITVSNITVIGGEFDFGGDASFGNLHADALYQNDNLVLDSTSTISIMGDATGSGNASNVAITLVNSGVTAGTYGSSGQIPVLGVDSKGRVITASNVAAATTGNLIFTDTTISTQTANANIFLSTSGTGTVQITGNTALGIPSGTTAERPLNATVGYIRYNTDTGGLETFDGTTWEAGSAALTSQVINGDGINNQFSLSSNVSQATDLIVSINGTLQQPATAYTVNGTLITFTETPATGDTIEVRHIATGISSIGSLSLGSSNVAIPAPNGAININTSGNLVLQIGTTGAVIGTYPSTVIPSSGVATNVDVFSTAIYRTAKYIFQANTGSAYESSEILVTHDGTTAYRTVYAVISTGGSLGNVSATINGTNVLVQYTADNNNTNVRTLKQYLII
jgi:hypothetical protein